MFLWGVTITNLEEFGDPEPLVMVTPHKNILYVNIIDSTAYVKSILFYICKFFKPL